ncbi:membrane protein [Paramyrothecium foliicola]|nr:membrane protein [Paramyrothecium foliicola]
MFEPSPPGVTMKNQTARDTAALRTEEPQETTPLLRENVPDSTTSSGLSTSGSDNSGLNEDTRFRRFLTGAKAFCDRNLGLFFAPTKGGFPLTEQMAMTTRLLATSFETKFHALQIIFVRMFFTGLIGSAYMWYKQVPGFPLGERKVRGLLVLRDSLTFLDISDATVITFLVPVMTTFVCWLALNEPFTVKEALAGLLAFVGVLFIARPAFLFPSQDENRPPVVRRLSGEVDPFGILPPVEATPAERTLAIACAILGSFSAATAYATIRIIGKRAHSLVSVNYFAVLATVMSFSIIMVHPDLKFEIPKTTAQWLLLCSIGVSGFLLQVFLTEGLQREKAGRATNLIYTQLVFALIIERVVWGTTPPFSSLLGSVFVIGAAVWVSVQKQKTQEQKPAPSHDEEEGLLNSES